MLTSQQYKLLSLIYRSVQETGITPSYEELRVAMGLRSKSRIHYLLVGLEERGFIRRLPRHWRAIEVIKVPAALKRTINKQKNCRQGINPGGKRTNENEEYTPTNICSQ